MKKLHALDANGFWVPSGDKIVESNALVPSGFTSVPVPQPNWKPKFTNGQWVETITDAELAALKPSAGEQSLEQRIKDLEAVIENAILEGVL